MSLARSAMSRRLSIPNTRIYQHSRILVWMKKLPFLSLFLSFSSSLIVRNDADDTVERRHARPAVSRPWSSLRRSLHRDHANLGSWSSSCEPHSGVNKESVRRFVAGEKCNFVDDRNSGRGVRRIYSTLIDCWACCRWNRRCSLFLSFSLSFSGIFGKCTPRTVMNYSQLPHSGEIAREILILLQSRLHSTEKSEKKRRNNGRLWIFVQFFVLYFSEKRRERRRQLIGRLWIFVFQISVFFFEKKREKRKGNDSSLAEYSYRFLYFFKKGERTGKKTTAANVRNFLHFSKKKREKARKGEKTTAYRQTVNIPTDLRTFLKKRKEKKKKETIAHRQTVWFLYLFKKKKDKEKERKRKKRKRQVIGSDISKNFCIFPEKEIKTKKKQKTTAGYEYL